MLCYVVMLCHFMLVKLLSYVMLRYVILRCVMLCYFMLRYITLGFVALCYVILCYVMLCYVVLCYVMWQCNDKESQFGYLEGSLLKSFVVYDAITRQSTHSPALLYASTHLNTGPVFLNRERLCYHCRSVQEAWLRRFLPFLDTDVVWSFLAKLAPASRDTEISPGAVVVKCKW
jgi:hypothetical protein